MTTHEILELTDSVEAPKPLAIGGSSAATTLQTNHTLCGREG
ncbi:MAG: hypothetical protein Q8R44_02160 [Novosphingobium sp.]|nr:hypothetical protein [Novosphingobium sp.]